MVRQLIILGASAALALHSVAQPGRVDEKTAVQIEALKRLKGADLDSNAALKSAVLRILEKTRGTPQFVEIVRDFKLEGHSDELLDYAITHPKETSAIEAFQLTLEEKGTNSLPALLNSTNALAIVQLIGNSKEKSLQPILKSLVADSSKPVATRKAAIQSLARSKDGAKYLIDLARSGELPPELRFTASSELNVAPWPEVKQAALEILPLPQAQNAQPLPPVSELVKRPGDAKRGREIFESQTAACASCHVVNGKGTDVGPQLSEIGTKLGKDALYEAILDPSSGISFGFEAWMIDLENGDELFGIITSETPAELTVKSQTGIISKVKKDEIARRQKLTTSLMPAGLQLTMSTQDLTDLVEYLASLKKARE